MFRSSWRALRALAVAASVDLLIVASVVSAQTAAAPPAAARVPESWSFTSEQEWIVGDIVSGIAELAGQRGSRIAVSRVAVAADQALAGFAVTAKVFPQGTERVDPDSTEAPADGLRVTRTGARGAAAGFREGDVIVGIDGTLVHNDQQLRLAWVMDASPEIAFQVWRDSRYLTIRGRIRDSWISGSFVEHRAAKAGTP